jgi:Fungal chitosanase of glycosyl hydrolase group 75
VRIIATIENETVTELNDGSVTYRSLARVDTDGSGDLHGDPFGQHDSSLHWKGRALDADVDKYVVVPPAIIQGVKPVVLGCQAHVLNLSNGRSSEAVVGDIGPHDKLGEVSNSCALALGLDPSPIDGGTEDHIIFYHLVPGQAANVDGKQYSLKPYRALK